MENTVTEAEDFASAVNVALEYRDMTRDELAHKIGRSPSSVSGWLNGRRLPPLEVVLLMESALDLDQGQLARYANQLMIRPAETDRSWEADFIAMLTKNRALTDSDRDMFIRIMRNVMEMRQALSETDAGS